MAKLTKRTSTTFILDVEEGKQYIWNTIQADKTPQGYTILGEVTDPNNKTFKIRKVKNITDKYFCNAKANEDGTVYRYSTFATLELGLNPTVINDYELLVEATDKRPVWFTTIISKTSGRKFLVPTFKAPTTPDSAAEVE